MSLVPASVVLISLVRRTVLMVRVAVNPASQNWPRERRNCSSSGKTSHFRADKGSLGKGERSVCVAAMVSPLGMSTRFPPWITATFLSHGKVAKRKWLVHLESTTANYADGVTSV